MTRARLEVDTDKVRSLSENLSVVHTNLSGAQATSDELAAMVAHPHLAEVVNDFSSQWDTRRTELLEQIDQLKTGATTVADTFETADNDLARSLTEEASSDAPSGAV